MPIELNENGYTTILVENETKKQIVLAEYGVVKVIDLSGASLALDDLTDVIIDTPTLDQVLTYNGVEWVNQDSTGGGGGDVSSVFTRTGDIVAEAGDYAAFYATLAQGALADTALQSGDSISLLDNDSGYITLGEVPEDTITSVFTRTGDVVAADGDYNITQMGDVNIDTVTNGQFLSYNDTSAKWENVTIGAPGAPAFGELTDVTFSGETDGQVAVYRAGVWVNEDQAGGSAAVTSVDGRTGDVTLDDLYAPIVHTHVKTDITDFDEADYATAAQGDLADTATQPGDDVSTLVNDSGYITLADLPTEAPIDTEQYVRTDATWTRLGDNHIKLADTFELQNDTNERLVGYSSTDGSDPNFPNTTFVTIGDDATGLNFSGTLFNPLKIKNDTAIQGYDSTYSTLSNLISISADDFATVGDGNIITALRGLDSANGPVVREGTAGSTTDYKIYHEGNLPADAVTSVDGRVGIVTLDDLYAPIVHTHVKTDITDFDEADYATAAQGALADSAIQPLDNVSELTNDALYTSEGDNISVFVNDENYIRDGETIYGGAY